MADRPIIFSAPMILALLRESREPGTGKTMTRRVLKPQPQDGQSAAIYSTAAVDWQIRDRLGRVLSNERLRCAPGDRLWVKEACGRRVASFLGIEATNGVEEAFYRADDEDVVERLGFNLCPWWRGPTCSPIHMPRVASRLTLHVTDVRVQRLQEISREDVIAEGVTHREREPIADVVAGWHEPFVRLWEGLHGEGSWISNPWVAAITFRPVLANIDAPETGAAAS